MKIAMTTSQKRDQAITVGLISSVVLVSAAITFFSWIASFLALWAIIFVFFSVGVILLWLAPAPGRTISRACLGLLCLYVFFVLVWPRYALLRLPGLPGVSPSRIVQGLMLIMWFYLILRGSRFRQILINRANNHRSFFFAVAGLLLFKFFGIFLSQNIFVSAKGFANELLSIYVILAVSLTVVEDRLDVNKVMLSVLLAFVVVCALGVIESIIRRNLFIGVFEVDSDYARQVLMEKIRAGSYRIQSTFSHPLTFSEFIVVSIPVVLSLLLTERFSWLKFMVCLALLGISSFAILKSGSRSGVGGFLISVGGWAALMSLRKAVISKDSFRAGGQLLVLITVCVLSIIAVFAISDLLVGKTTRELNSGLVRLEMWSHGIRMALEQPFLGYGQDMAATTLGFVEGDGNITIDSYYLSVLLESGIFSLVLYCYLLIYLSWTAFRVGLNNEKSGSLALALCVSIVSFSVMKTVLSLPHNHGIFMALFSLILVLSRNDNTDMLINKQMGRVLHA